MLKIRFLILAIVLVPILMLTYQFVAARTEVISNPSNDPASVTSSKEGLTKQFEVADPSSPSKFDECADLTGVGGSVVACHNPSQIPPKFEVSGPSYPSTFDECVDMPGVAGSIVACRNPSQIPAP